MIAGFLQLRLVCLVVKKLNFFVIFFSSRRLDIIELNLEIKRWNLGMVQGI